MSKVRSFSKGKMEDVLVDAIIYISLVIMVIVTLYPVINVIAVSLNDAIDSLIGGIGLWPRKFSWNNYVYIFSNKQIYTAFVMSVLRTVAGTLTSITAVVMLAFILSRKDFVFRKQLNVFVVVTMYFSGGLIPVYFLFKSLGMINNFYVYVIPSMIYAFNVIFVRSYIEQLPDSFVESAQMDGAGELRTLFQIIIPLSLPAIATIALFVSVWHWNDWYTTFLYNSSKKNLSTLQYELMRILQATSQNLRKADQAQGLVSNSVNVTPVAIRAAMTVIATVPVLVVYPFLQKYFVSGLTLGGVKG